VSAPLITVRRRGPGSRADAMHPTRRELVDAAFVVADRIGIGAMSVNDVTSEAGLAKGTFYVHFDDRTALLVEMHRRFHDDVFAHINTSVTGPPGAEHARARLIAFLDTCRSRPGVRSVLLAARGEPAIAAEVRSRNDLAARSLAADLRACAPHHAHPFETARLIVAATAEVAGLELAAGRRLAPLRAALLSLIPDV
jgi:TetR/AcrR family transcriptional regulator, transcriptional repressor for nem operon